MNPALLDAVRRMVERLVAGDFDGIERATQGRRLTREEMQKAVREYGRTLRMPPDESLSKANVIELRNRTPRAYYVGVDLWTLEEGRSDLTLEMTLIEQGDGYSVEIDTIHVL